MARRVNIDDLLDGEGIKIYLTDFLRYQKMLEDVLSLLTVPAGSLATTPYSDAAVRF